MIKLSWCAIGMLVFAGAAWAGAATAPKPADSVAAGMRDFDRNTALGAELMERTGTKQELDELQALAERGLKAARELVAAKPKSAEAQYLLGSWLIYGARVITSEEITTDASGEQQVKQVPEVAMGLSDDPQEGLDALREAAELAPGRGEYTLDYAAALVDTDHPDQAAAVLRTAWAGQPKLTAIERMRAGMMLSDALMAEDRIAEAREWLYATLLINPENAEVVRRLRLLDASLAAAPSAELEAPWEAPEEAAPEAGFEPGEEAAPESEETPEEYAPAAEEEQPQEAAPEDSGPQEEGTEGEGTDTPPDTSGEEAGY